MVQNLHLEYLCHLLGSKFNTKIKFNTMKKISIYILSISFLFSCNKTNFSDTTNFLSVENPNLSEAVVVGQPNSSTIWKEGIERQLANALNEILILAELGSDNYVNTQTFYNQFLDKLEIRTDDPDMEDTFFDIARLREMARFGIEKVGPSDSEYNAELEAEFHFFEGLANLYAAMYFSNIPSVEGGATFTSVQNYEAAITSFTTAISTNPKAEYYLASARAHYYLGNQTQAKQMATSALATDSDFARGAKFDELNGPANIFESALFERATFDDLQPLPTLDFLDPKYSFIDAETDPLIYYLKAEEAHLILAESNLKDGALVAAQNNLTNLLTLVGTREIRTIDDSIEGRPDASVNSDNFPKRPNLTTDVVNGRTGLVLDRQAGDVNVPSVSGTSLTQTDVDNMVNDDTALELLYRTRQEVFIAEGLRFADMGVKLVIHQNEFLQNTNISDGDAGTIAIIPSFIDAVKLSLDAMTYDTTTGVASTQIDLNKILVANKSSAEVLPFH